MARIGRKKRRKSSNKMTGSTPSASLAAMAPVIESKGIFQTIHQQFTKNSFLMRAKIRPDFSRSISEAYSIHNLLKYFHFCDRLSGK